MAKYRKKPVVIEAIQATLDNVDELVEFCEGNLKSHPLVGVVIETLEGKMNVSKGDYVIKGVKGEFYPCKPDIFEMTYEPMLEPNDKKTRGKFRIKIQELHNGRKFYTAQVRIKKHFFLIPYYSWYFINKSFDARNLGYECSVHSLEDAESLIDGYCRKIVNIQGWETKRTFYMESKQQGNDR